VLKQDVQGFAHYLLINVSLTQEQESFHPIDAFGYAWMFFQVKFSDSSNDTQSMLSDMLGCFFRSSFLIPAMIIVSFFKKAFSAPGQCNFRILSSSSGPGKSR